MAYSPTFTSTPRTSVVTVATANANRDGTGTIATLIAGVAAGTKIIEIDVTPSVTTTAGMLRIFISTDSGTTWKLFDEISIAAATPSASVKTSRNTATYSNLILVGTTQVLGVAPNNAESMNVTVFGADLT
jgi:hypothetical protein